MIRGDDPVRIQVFKHPMEGRLENKRIGQLTSLFECYLVSIKIIILVMRRRYFSPELRETLEAHKSKQPSKLRWVGSQVKLPTISLE